MYFAPANAFDNQDESAKTIWRDELTINLVIQVN